jgi:hypothetical protein
VYKLTHNFRAVVATVPSKVCDKKYLRWVSPESIPFGIKLITKDYNWIYLLLSFYVQDICQHLQIYISDKMQNACFRVKIRIDSDTQGSRKRAYITAWLRCKNFRLHHAKIIKAHQLRYTTIAHYALFHKVVRTGRAVCLCCTCPWKCYVSWITNDNVTGLETQTQLTTKITYFIP